MGVPSYPLSHEKRFVCYVLNTMLGGGMSSRLFQVVREDRGLMVITATKLALSKPDATAAVDLAARPKPVAPAAPPEVLFSMPVDGEPDVATTAIVRIQLSRTIDRASLVDHVRVGYVTAPGAPAAGIDREGGRA